MSTMSSAAAPAEEGCGAPAAAHHLLVVHGLAVRDPELIGAPWGSWASTSNAPLRSPPSRTACGPT
ncbi:hypothetical protein ACIBU0_31310 [Streptomyces sp. NPDC049627]|uniref:hypothetical protein n=1 Tax=Streptomyces sp. NPDC049627 TaxID=3365595 RepID=UPI0037A460B6